jgi:predicted phage terminase large subunit-like protein
VTFHLTSKQHEAQAILASDAKHLMLFGGSRSGKTFLLVRNIVMRALKAADSRHVIFRYRFNSVKASIVIDTFPKVMRLAFPGVAYKIDKTDWYATFPNGAQLWFGGLDDPQRAEKILGMEFVTVYLNECSQIPYESRNLALTRLAQSVEQQAEGLEGQLLKPRVYYDENPPSKAHWSYRLFVQKLDPETKRPLPAPEDYAWFKINPTDNTENIAADYLETLEGMSARLRKRFLDGEFGDATPGALFTDEAIDRWRHDGALPDMVRVAVGVDPSGSGDVDNADNDAIGIVVVGLGTDGNAYVLEDCTVKAGPATWGRVATEAYARHEGDVVVGEVNYGGAMVNHVVQTARPRTPFRSVTASRGKVVRAEPFSSLYEIGKVRHAGRFAELEDELTSFTTNGYLGGSSPNRADALIWALADLFPAIVAGPKHDTGPVSIPSLRTPFARGRSPSAAIPSLR